MDAFLDTLLNRLAVASLQTLLFAAFIWALCRLLPSLSAATRSWMWWLVAAQMVVGLCVPGRIELPLLPATAPAQALHLTPATVMFTELRTAPTVADVWHWSWDMVLLAAWSVLVAVQAAIGIVRWRRIAGVVSRALPHDDVRLETLCAQRARALGLRRSPRLAVSAEVDSPQVVGLWRPTILLPLDDTFGDDEREMALMHELAHVRRGDLILGGIPALARTLFFFHPAAHMAVREYALCREAACDALAVGRGQLAPGSYGRLLLRLGVTPHPHHALPGASPTFRILKRRLDMLGQSQDARPRVVTTLVVAALAIAAALPWRVVEAGQQQVDTPTPMPAAAAAPATPVVHTIRPKPAPATPPSPPAPAAPVPMGGVAPVAPAAPAAPVPPPAPPAPTFGAAGHHSVSIEDHGVQKRYDSVDGKLGYISVIDDTGRWELRDPAYLARIRTVWEKAFNNVKLPPAPGIDPKRQAELDRRQAVLNEQMTKLAERQATLSEQASDPSRPHDPAAYGEGHATIGREQGEVARELAEIGRERAEEGRSQAAWGQAHADAAQKANEQVEAILAEARRNHALVRAD